MTDRPPRPGSIVSWFDSDLHALLAGAISAVLDFRNLSLALVGQTIRVVPVMDEDGNWMPEWDIRVQEHADAAPKAIFRLLLTQEEPHR